MFCGEAKTFRGDDTLGLEFFFVAVFGLVLVVVPPVTSFDVVVLSRNCCCCCCCCLFTPDRRRPLIEAPFDDASLATVSVVVAVDIVVVVAVVSWNMDICRLGIHHMKLLTHKTQTAAINVTVVLNLTVQPPPPPQQPPLLAVGVQLPVLVVLPAVLSLALQVASPAPCVNGDDDDRRCRLCRCRCCCLCRPVLDGEVVSSIIVIVVVMVVVVVVAFRPVGTDVLYVQCTVF
jgi:hypothetical protein